MVYDMLIEQAFLSTPSGWRATFAAKTREEELAISIHALRVEGDRAHTAIRSRPPISIHALRVEGDCRPSDA